MSESIEVRLKAKAREFSFELAGIARATDADNFAHYQDWLDHGYAGEMEYLHYHAPQRRHPGSILQDVRSVLMVGMTYGPSSPLSPASRERGEDEGVAARCEKRESLEPARETPLTPNPSPPEAGGEGNKARVAKYAQAPDYHQFLWDRLNPLGDWLDSQLPGVRSHGVADTAPLLERDFARRAGLGWIGKNTMLINKQLGSFFVLGALLTTAELEPDPPHVGEHCGTCTACLEACPTQAFPSPGVLDARRCISYLTIELKTAIPEELRPGVGDWLFGCDICQDVCPWNHKPIESPGLPWRADLAEIDPAELLTLSPGELRRRFKGTSLRRANWRGLLRNAAIILGNRGDRRALPALKAALNWKDEIVREACEWAIGRLEGHEPVSR